MKVAIMGYGTIGSGVAEILEVNKKVLSARCGKDLELKYILDLRDFPGDPNEDKLVKDYQVIVDDAEVEMVVETMGGVEPAFTFVKAMLEAGKHVTTSNKALVADKGSELLAIAREKNVNFQFEASVGGGIPIIRNLQECLTADVIESITAIVNGTTNYMMAEMTDKGAEFDAVLADAQAKGYAEKDPTADIEGHDACRKIAILTSLICGQQVDYEDIPTQGISHITATDIKYAKAMGRKIKLLATSTLAGDTYQLRVAPYLISPAHPLFNVDGVFNAVLVHGNMLSDSMFYGCGAGKLPTASAVVADMVEMAINSDRNIPVKWDPEKLIPADPSQQKYAFFVRSTANEAEIEDNFGKVEFVSIPQEGYEDEIGFITEVMTEASFAERAALMGEINQTIRMGA